MVEVPVSKFAFACASCSPIACFCASSTDSDSRAASTSKNACAARSVRSCAASISCRSAWLACRPACSSCTALARRNTGWITCTVSALVSKLRRPGWKNGLEAPLSVVSVSLRFAFALRVIEGSSSARACGRRSREACQAARADANCASFSRARRWTSTRSAATAGPAVTAASMASRASSPARAARAAGRARARDLAGRRCGSGPCRGSVRVIGRAESWKA